MHATFTEEVQSAVMEDVAQITSHGTHITDAIGREMLSETHRFAVTIQTNIHSTNVAGATGGDDGLRVLVMAAKSEAEVTEWVAGIRKATSAAEIVMILETERREGSIRAQAAAEKAVAGMRSNQHNLSIKISNSNLSHNPGSPGSFGFSSLQDDQSPALPSFGTASTSTSTLTLQQQVQVQSKAKPPQPQLRAPSYASPTGIVYNNNFTIFVFVLLSVAQLNQSQKKGSCACAVMPTRL
jgi:hypothetical protein